MRRLAMEITDENSVVAIEWMKSDPGATKILARRLATHTRRLLDAAQ